MQNEISVKPLVDVLSEQLGEQVVMNGEKYILLSNFSEISEEEIDKSMSIQEELLNIELKEQTRQTAKDVRDKSLQNIVHVVSGSAYQVRPQDLGAYKLAIDSGIDTDWVTKDNTVRFTTITELKAILSSGIAQGKEIWNIYMNKLKDM